MLLCSLLTFTYSCPLLPTLGPGYISHHLGETVFVSHHLAIQIDHTDTLRIPDVLLEMAQEIVIVTNQLKYIANLTSDLNLHIIPELLKTLNLTSYKIKQTLRFFPDTRLNNRPERGLLNVVGIALSYLFGIASSNDIEKLNKRFITLDELKNRETLILDKLLSRSNQQHSKINEIITDINAIGKHLTNITELINIQFELDYLISYINNLHREIDTCLNNVKNELDNIVLASKGIVTTNIISLDELSIILATAKTEHNLDPIFPSNQLASYYNVIYVLIAPQALILQVPMSSTYVFNHFRFIPFPTYNHNETVILRLNKTDLLISHDSKYFTEATKEQFSSCQRSDSLLICPSNVLPLFNALDKTSCLNTLLANNSSPTGCVAQQVPNQLQIEVVPPRIFITRAVPTKARLTCPDGSSVISHRTFSFREDCTLEDRNILIVGRSTIKYALHHKGDYAINLYQPTNFTAHNWKIIRPLKQTDNAHLFYTSTVKVVIPSTASVLGLMFILLFVYCIVKKRFLRKDVAPETINLHPQDIRCQHVAI